MKRNIYFLLVLFILAGCSSKRTIPRQTAPGDELIGNWKTNGTFYAGSLITGTTTFIFNQDKTFAALDEAKGMPSIKETGIWHIKGDTLKIRYNKQPAARPDVISFEDRSGGSRDLLKPVKEDSNGFINWNYKIAGNKLILANKNFQYSGPSSLEKIQD